MEKYKNETETQGRLLTAGKTFDCILRYLSVFTASEKEEKWKGRKEKTTRDTDSRSSTFPD